MLGGESGRSTSPPRCLLSGLLVLGLLITGLPFCGRARDRGCPMELGAQSPSWLRGHCWYSAREPPPWMAAWPFYISDTGAPQTTTQLTKRSKGSPIWLEAPNSKEHNPTGSYQQFTDFSSLSFPFLCWQEIQNSYIWCHLCLHLISATYHLTINTLCLPLTLTGFQGPT